MFDAAAPFKGKCLNDTIFSGPALQPVLSAVLIQFREIEVAWAADVEAMFSRFRLRPADANYFCFLWREVESEETIICRMDRLLFGTTCSPFIAINTCRRAAIDAKADEQIVQVIKRKVYVDDYLSSASSIRKGLEEAVVVERIIHRRFASPRVDFKFIRVCPDNHQERRIRFGQDHSATSQ